MQDQKKTESSKDNGPVRLNKFLSDAGVCSRREADRAIEAGEVTVNGVTAVMGQKAGWEDVVVFRGETVKPKREHILLAVYKPPGVVCTTAEDEPANIVTYVGYPVRIYPVGRLDKDSEGLVLMTNEGDLVNKILRGSNDHEKEYIVRINRPVTEEFLQKMGSGVPILDTVTKPCQVEKVGRFVFRIILTQGLNRQIRRMCEALDCRVLSLKRVRVMNIRLGDMKPGTWRKIEGKEKDTLMQMLKGSSGLSYQERMKEKEKESRI